MPVDCHRKRNIPCNKSGSAGKCCNSDGRIMRKLLRHQYDKMTEALTAGTSIAKRTSGGRFELIMSTAFWSITDTPSGLTIEATSDVVKSISNIPSLICFCFLIFGSMCAY